MARIKKEEEYRLAKENLENALMQLFYTRNLEDIKIKDICEKAGVGVGTFYHYYKNKEQILVERFRHIDKCLLEEVRPKIEKMDFIDGYFEYIDTFIQIGKVRKLEYIRQVYKSYIVNMNDNIDFKGREIYKLLEDTMYRGLEEGVLKGNTNVEKAAEYLFIALKGVTFNWCSYGENYNFEEEIIGFSKMFLAGMINEEYADKVKNFEVAKETKEFLCH